MYRQYLTEKIGDDTLHKTAVRFSNKEMPVDVYLDSIGSTHGENVFLIGDLGTVQLDYTNQAIFPENPKYEGDILAIIDHEFSGEDGAAPDDENQNWRPNKAWHYQLPKDKKLSDISSTGKLRIRVEIK